MMLDAAELADQLDGFKITLFRLEVRSAYDVGDDGQDVARFLAGEAEPTRGRKQRWLERLSADREAGRIRQRVHVLRTPLTPYLEYECAWGYAPNEDAGEEIRILDLSEQREEPLAPIIDQDFWLVDEERLVLMHYDVCDRLVGGSIVTDRGVVDGFRATRDAAWRASVPFATFWARHRGAAQPEPGRPGVER